METIELSKQSLNNTRDPYYDGNNVRVSYYIENNGRDSYYIDNNEKYNCYYNNHRGSYYDHDCHTSHFL